MQTRKASIKETGEELPPADWERFDAAVAELKDERKDDKPSVAPDDRKQGSDGDGQAVA